MLHATVAASFRHVRFTQIVAVLRVFSAEILLHDFGENAHFEHTGTSLFHDQMKANSPTIFLPISV